MAERKVNSTNYQNQAFLENKCSLNELMVLLSRRWITEILFCIEEGNNRFSGIKEELAPITDHILADRLKLLEKNSLINRQHFPEVPPRVVYSLTERGTELCRLLEKLCDFSDTIPVMLT
ncbi:helix-turn-helix transcriptional regulator [Chitinophaga agrisoli]|uniref:Helix-turn-helix transcriptional regulator n=1 Tax=Chitinophaga agrisoli TaxID=2607653 RepID=A0A5B2VY78_9BACT|nr:helix-turn-helix domain-containing protein [Chitinophaga agrisoli]KAA2244813.1 helix-turn-helix transcriptional regulator [Chitinophaga agrisoli]